MSNNFYNKLNNIYNNTRDKNNIIKNNNIPYKLIKSSDRAKNRSLPTIKQNKKSKLFFNNLIL